MGSEYVSREKKSTMVIFLFLCGKMCLQLDSKRSKSAHSRILRKCVFCVFTLYRYRGILAQNTPKSDFRGPKIPPIGAKFTMKHVVLYRGHLYKLFLTKKI